VSLHDLVPWWAKICAKLALSRVPLTYRVWRRLGIFRHGEMDRPERAVEVFEIHYGRAARCVELRPGFVALELGPGDSLLSGLVAYSRGASRTYFVDTGAYAARDIRPYRELARALNGCGRSLPEVGEDADFDEVAAKFSLIYLTGGQASLVGIPEGSVDFAWSHVVLEHVRRREFEQYVHSLRSVMRKGGVCSHTIDLRDHLGGALNNLRFSERVWESDFMARSGFYTNRLRQREVLEVFSAAGFRPLMVDSSRWESLPTPRQKLAEPFRRMHKDDLLVAEFAVVLEAA
jgi:SAM-dependent methyltransferase